MDSFIRLVMGMSIFVYGTLVTCIVLSMAGFQPDSFYDVFVPWLVLGFVLMAAPKRIGGIVLALCHVTMVGSLFVGAYFLSLNVIAYFQEEPDSICSYDCPQPIPDTSDLIDLETHTGDNNNSPGTHSVDGHYRGGTYVEPYMRSNPDGDPNNNLND